ncbi:hypothetical protein [Marinitoga lauensis]|nr:hypothetical protein [Marinitoga lauensis]
MNSKSRKKINENDEFLKDLNIDRIINSILYGWEEYYLKSFYLTPFQI